MRQINKTALFQLKAHGGYLSPQQYKTIKGQILSGDDKGAMKGLKKILRRSKEMRYILEQAIRRNGVEMQLNVCIEELSELIKELCKFKRGKGKMLNIAEEMADVRIILRELELIFGNKQEVAAWEKIKIDRLQAMLQGGLL